MARVVTHVKVPSFQLLSSRSWCEQTAVGVVIYPQKPARMTSWPWLSWMMPPQTLTRGSFQKHVVFPRDECPEMWFLGPVIVSFKEAVKCLSGGLYSCTFLNKKSGFSSSSPAFGVTRVIPADVKSVGWVGRNVELLFVCSRRLHTLFSQILLVSLPIVSGVVFTPLGFEGSSPIWDNPLLDWWFANTFSQSLPSLVTQWTESFIEQDIFNFISFFLNFPPFCR